MKSSKRLVFLASGRGSCFQAICAAIRQKRLPQAEAVALICNKPGAPVLGIARDFQVPATALTRETFPEYEKALAEQLESLDLDWICLAGYMRILSPAIVSRWKGRILNIHPSLLPSFRGLRAQKQALEAGVRWTGCTVHLVTEELDHGPILEQTPIEILPGDTEISLSERLLPIEHMTYIKALTRACTQTFHLDGSRVIWSTQLI